MTPNEVESKVYIGETKKEEPKKLTLNREQKRRLAEDLRRSMSRATMPDMANVLRAKRTAKRREAAKVKNLNRRMAK